MNKSGFFIVLIIDFIVDFICTRVIIALNPHSFHPNLPLAIG